MPNDSVNTSLRRRQLLKTIGVGAIGVTAADATMGTVGADDSGSHYHNLLYEPLFPDPSVIPDRPWNCPVRWTSTFGSFPGCAGNRS